MGDVKKMKTLEKLKKDKLETIKLINNWDCRHLYELKDNIYKLKRILFFISSYTEVDRVQNIDMLIKFSDIPINKLFRGILHRYKFKLPLIAMDEVGMGLFGYSIARATSWYITEIADIKPPNNAGAEAPAMTSVKEVKDNTNSTSPTRQTHETNYINILPISHIKKKSFNVFDSIYKGEN